MLTAFDFSVYPYPRDLFLVDLETGVRLPLDVSEASPGEAAWSAAGASAK